MITSLVVENLSISRGARRLFQGLGFGLAAGEALAITGVNGAGKTTLLRCLAGLVRPDAGSVAFMNAGMELEAEGARRDHLHLLGHADGLKSARTARSELAFQGRWTGAGSLGLSHAIQVFDLAPLLGLEVRVLSAGQRRRLALARLVASPRSLWLLDEPLAPLDADRRRRVGELMEGHLKAGGMIIAAVHDPLPIDCRLLELAS